MKDPYSWISEDCVPPGFEWKDPSKIKIADVFDLLNHWRDRQDHGLDPLIWLPTCPVLQGTEGFIRRGRNLRGRGARRQDDTDEEMFHLPSSGDMDEMDEVPDDVSDANKVSDGSQTESGSTDDGESIDLNMDPPPTHVFQQKQGSSGKHGIYSSIISFTHMFHSIQDYHSMVDGPPTHNQQAMIIDHWNQVSISSTSHICY